MLAFSQHHAALAFHTQQAVACPGAKYTFSSRRACLSGWRRADVASVEAGCPSTSYAASASCWQPPHRPITQRRIAAPALPAPEVHPLPSPDSGDGKVGVVIVDHGSRKKASNEMLVEFGDLYGRVTGQEIVEIAHMEIAAPSIEDAVGRCVARGARTVVVAPYFLSRGRHIQEDIPALVLAAQRTHPGVNCVIAEPIGIDSLMVQLISNRVKAALSAEADGAGADGAKAKVEA